MIARLVSLDGEAVRSSAALGAGIETCEIVSAGVV